MFSVFWFNWAQAGLSGKDECLAGGRRVGLLNIPEHRFLKVKNMRTEVHCVRLHFLSESNNLPKMNKRRRDSLNLDETTVNELQVPFVTSQSAA